MIQGFFVYSLQCFYEWYAVTDFDGDGFHLEIIFFNT